MSAYRYDTILECGATFTRVLLIKAADGTLVDLSNWTAAAKMRPTYKSTTAYTFTCAVNESESTITMNLSAGQTTNIPAGRYVYDLEATDSAGNVRRLIEGILDVRAEATRG